MRTMRLINTMKKELCASLVLLLACACAWPQVPDVLKRIQDRGQVNVGFSEEAPPFSLRVEGGAPIGYSIDLCAAVVERIKQATGRSELRVKYLPVPTDQLLRIVGSGGVDLMCAGTSDTPERRVSMAFSQPIFISSVKLLVRADSGIRGAADLQGKSVAVLGRTTATGGQGLQ
jgi:glutamate/aspartate transport system substrate-binding protein